MKSITFPRLDDAGTQNMALLFATLLAYVAQDMPAFKAFAVDLAMNHPANLKEADWFAQLTPAHFLIICETLEVK